MRYSCLIVEDELPAQKVLLNFIGKLDTLELKGVCKNALEASDFLIRESVDLMFLDINLPGFSGIEFLKSLTKTPKVIFTTAYAEFAVEGFDLEVVDYLIKPFAFERFAKAVQRAINSVKNEVNDLSFATSDNNEAKSNYVFIKSDKKYYRIDIEEIKLVESLRDYVKIICGDEVHIVLQSLRQWEDILNAAQFTRVHKSFIVNLAKIDSVEGNVIYLAGYEIPIGRSYREAFIKKLENRQL